MSKCSRCRKDFPDDKLDTNGQCRDCYLLGHPLEKEAIGTMNKGFIENSNRRVNNMT